MSNSCFYLRPEKDDNKVLLEDKDLEVIGSSGVIHYDDSTVILQHIESGLWFSYKVSWFIFLGSQLNFILFDVLF